MGRGLPGWVFGEEEFGLNWEGNRPAPETDVMTGIPRR